MSASPKRPLWFITWFMAWLMASVMACLMAAIAAIIPSEVRAQAVYCANCGEEYTQWLNYLKLAAQLEKQAALLQHADRAAAPLPSQQWGAGVADIRAINRLLAQAKSLSYASSNLDARFAAKFRDYEGYVRGRLDHETMAGKYRQWSEDANSSVKSTLQAARAANEQIEGGEEALMRRLESLAEGAEGELAAQQAANMLAAQTVRQIQKLRQLMLMNMQLEANYMQIAQDRHAAEMAAWRKFTTFPKIDTRNGARF